MLHSRHQDNPRLFDDEGNVAGKQGQEYLNKLARLTGARRLRLERGLWVAAEGMVYEDWDPAVHVLDERALKKIHPGSYHKRGVGWLLPKDWPRIWSLDFGYTNPFVCQMWARDPDGRLIMYREFYRTKRTVDLHALDILAAVRLPADGIGEPDPLIAHHWVWREPRPIAIVADHDAGDRALFERVVGQRTTAAVKGVTGGIQLTEARMQPRGDGRRGVYILADARHHAADPDLVDKVKPTCTAEELPGYVWDTAGGKKTKEEPVKEDDHGCDAMRYLVAWADKGRPNIRIAGS